MGSDWPRVLRYFLRGRGEDNPGSWMTQVVAMAHLAFRITLIIPARHGSCHTVLPRGGLDEWLLRFVLYPLL